jgi:hypothetical protein
MMGLWRWFWPMQQQNRIKQANRSNSADTVLDD